MGGEVQVTLAKIINARHLTARAGRITVLDMSNATRTDLTDIDADGEEFALDFGFPAVTTRPVVTRDEDTADGRAALDSRKGRNAAWRDTNLIPKARG